MDYFVILICNSGWYIYWTPRWSKKWNNSSFICSEDSSRYWIYARNQYV